MTSSLRLFLCLVGLTAGLVVAETMQPRWWQSLFPRPEARTVLVSVPDSDVVARRIAAKTAVMRKFRDGDLTLFETAGWFRYLNAEPPETPDNYWKHLPGESVNEKHCRQVIVWLGPQMADRAPASEIKVVRQRLEKELGDHLAQHGKVILPGWDD